MCDIITTTPDAHLTAMTSHITTLILGLAESAISVGEKLRIDANYLQDLETHKEIKKSPPTRKEMHDIIVRAINDQVGRYKQTKENERETAMKLGRPVYEFCFPEGFADTIATMMNPIVE